MPRKIAAVTIFRYFFVFLTNQMGFWSPQNNSAKIAKNRGCNYLSYFTIFRYFLLFSLTRRGFPIQQILRKKKREKSETQRFFALNDFSFNFVFLTYQTALPNWTNYAKIEKKSWLHFTISRYFFVVITYQRGLPNLTNSPKNAKKSFRFLTLIFFLTSSSLSRRADVKLIVPVSHWILQSCWYFNWSFDAQCVL